MKGRRRNLPFWALLTIWLVMAIGFAAYQWFLVRQDNAIAPREQVALGSMYKLTHGKSTTAFYSFTVAGKEYKGSEMVRSDHCFCDVAVYFDPNDPSTNTLVEYRRKSRQDHAVMMGCSYAALGLAVILACVLMFKKATQNQEAEYSHVS